MIPQRWLTLQVSPGLARRLPNQGWPLNMPAMQRCDILILPRWCIPVEPDGATLTDRAVAVNEGRILEVLSAAEAKSKYRPREIVDRPNHVLIPGLVNAHTHAAMTLFRGIADDLPLERWLTDGIWPSEKRWASAEMVRDGTRHAIAEMLRSGVTCFSDQYFFPEVVAMTAAELHMRAMVGTPVVDFATSWAKDAAECITKGTDLVHDCFADDPLISSCFAPHSTYTVSDAAFVELRVVADQLDKGIQIHLHETAREVADSLRATGRRPLQRLADLGLVNSSLLVVHAVHMNDEELGLLAEAGVSVAHCPRSNLKLASGIANVPAMQAAGINVALGTDSAASNNVLDMLGEMRTAALLAKAVSANAAAMSAREVLRMATLGGARAIGLGDSIGSIEQGKWADLACVSLQAINSQPVYDPLSQLVYTTQPDQVTDVWVGGRHQVDNGRLTEINETDLLKRSLEWQQRISAKTGN
ncbi:MAG: TRZ/ATZ family hydrolase [Woeseia sp.]